MNSILILREGRQIAFVFHGVSLWYFAFRASVPGKYQSAGFLFHAQINLITSMINDICSMKREKTLHLPQDPAPIPAMYFFSDLFIVRQWSEGGEKKQR